MFYAVLGLLTLALVPIVAGIVVATSRWLAARALGMRGVHFFFGGAVENAEAAASWRRALVVGAAIFASYLLPASLFAAVLLVDGREVPSTVVRVEPQHPAAEAGLTTGDRVLSVGGRHVATWGELTEAIRAHTGAPVELVVQRATGEAHLMVTPRGAPGRGKIGIVAVPEHEQPGIAFALMEGLRSPAAQLVDHVRSVAKDLGDADDELASGPVGLIRETTPRNPLANAMRLLAILFSYAWPLAAMVAVGTVPRRRRPGGSIAARS
jgi:membrane-associated protease RseP (regulator of RpoE activity)